MDLNLLKQKFGNWLSIEELRGFLANTPEEICRGVPIDRGLLEMASEFVEERKGWWEHPDWENYLARLQKAGYRLSEESKAPVGSILEIFKVYYHGSRFQTIRENRQEPLERIETPIPKPAVQAPERPAGLAGIETAASPGTGEPLAPAAIRPAPAASKAGEPESGWTAKPAGPEVAPARTPGEPFEASSSKSSGQEPALARKPGKRAASRAKKVSSRNRSGSKDGNK
jgi:hypothetical protein